MNHQKAVYVVSIFILVAVVLRLPAQQSPYARAEPNDSGSLRAIFEEDQRDRANFDSASVARDTKRREQVRRLIDEGKVQSAQDYFFAAMIFQHGQNPSDYLLAHVLAVTAATKGSKAGLWLSAATLDRYLQSTQKAQIFGTQFLGDKTLTQEPYDTKLIPDTLRAAWCVVPYAAQVSILADANAGKTLRSTGCLSN